MGSECVAAALKAFGHHYDGEVAYSCPVCGDPKLVYRRVDHDDTAYVVPSSYACRCEIEAEKHSERKKAERKVEELKARAYRGSGVAKELTKLRLDDLDDGLREAAELVLNGLLDEGRSGNGITLSCRSDKGRRLFGYAVVNALCEAGMDVSYVCIQAFLRAIKLTYNDPDGGESESSLLMDKLNASVLVIDGLGTCRSSSWLLGILDELVSGARRAGMKLIATTPLELGSLKRWMTDGDGYIDGLLDRLLQRSPFVSVESIDYEGIERVRSIAKLEEAACSFAQC